MIYFIPSLYWIGVGSNLIIIMKRRKKNLFSKMGNKENGQYLATTVYILVFNAQSFPFLFWTRTSIAPQMELCRIAALINPKTHKSPHFAAARRQTIGSDSFKKSFTSQISFSSPKANSCTNLEAIIPTMSEIMESSRAQNLDLQLQTLGPFFRITARNLKTRNELGRAEGLTRVWVGGKILHLDSIKLNRETLGMERSIFGIGVFIGAVAIRHGYDSGCAKAELLAINDSDIYHSKVCYSFRRQHSEFLSPTRLRLMYMFS